VTENDRAPRDPIYEFQRWLMRNGAKSVGRELKGTVSRTFGGGRQDPGDVWETATTEPPNVGEAPECAWCPVCRAARRFRDSGPGIASHVAGAGDALLSVAQDTLAAFEATLSARVPPGHKSPAGTGWPGEPGDRPEGAGSSPAPAVPTGPPSAPPAGAPTVTHSAPPPVPAATPPPATPPPATPPPAAHTVPPAAPHDEPPPAPPAAPPSAPDSGAPSADGAATTGATETGPAESGPSGAGAGPADDT
jgi:hypothetical protein